MNFKNRLCVNPSSKLGMKHTSNYNFFSQTTTQHHGYCVAILTMQDHAFLQSLVIQGFS